MDIQKIKLDKIRINKDNPRTITKEKMDKLVNSILVFPKMLEIRPIVVDGNMTALGGNQRTEALKRISKMSDDYIQEKLSGISDYHRLTKEEQDALIKFWKDWMKSKEVPIINADNLTEEEKNQFIIKDNNSFGEWDFAELQEKWDTSTLEDWGIDFPAEWYSPEKENKEVEEDDFTEEDAAKAETRVNVGEIWQLGEHRLMCGDSTKKEDVERLMNGEKADMVFTDPPYGIKIVGKNGKVGAGNIAKNKVYMEVKGDETTDTAKDNFNLLSSLGFKKFILFGGNYFTDFLPFSDGWIIWDKRGNMASNNFADGEMAWCSFHTPIRIYKQIWNGMIREGESEKRVHPTQKPIKLISDILNDFTKEDEIILDCFGGSGSTLIACEQINRKCRMIEYEPYYCDVIIARWEKLTGKEAVKIYG